MYGSHDFMNASKKKAFDLNDHGKIVKLPKREESSVNYGLKR